MEGLKWMKFILVLIVLLSFLACSKQESATELRVSEGLENPMGFYDAMPSFSWKLPQGVQMQKAYAIVVASSPDLLPSKADLWTSGKVTSDQSVYVDYGGSAFSSRQQAYWQVRYWDQDDQASTWSDVAHFELGLLSNNDWVA